MPRTKIICTIGPASEDPKIQEEMLKAGMDIARLNFSHGNHSHHHLLIKNLRLAAKRRGKIIGILGDLQGPRIRIGWLPREGIAVKDGERVILTTDVDKSGAAREPNKIPFNFPGIHKDIKVGELVLIDDGQIRMESVQISGKDIVCKVLIGGKILSHKGINLPQSKLHIETFTDKDRNDLRFAIKEKIDFVAMSFVRRAADINLLRKYLPKKNPPKVIAKIEKIEAVKNFNEILEATDGVMVARGDLALEIGAEHVPVVQKEIIKKCLLLAKPVIVATQMLQSMVSNLQPTRAEASDVANAVIDHADAVMLSAESASGAFPVDAVKMLAKIADETEESSFDDIDKMLDDFQSPLYRKFAKPIRTLAEGIGAEAIIIIGASSPELAALSCVRPERRIVSINADPIRAHHQIIHWGVVPLISKFIKQKDVDKLLLQAAKRRMWKKGNPVVVVWCSNEKADRVYRIESRN
jgi:pyruvate kinase